MKPKHLLSMMVAAAMIAGTMPVTVFAGRLDYEPEDTDVPAITETEEAEPTKPAAKENKPAEKEPEKVKETEAPAETEAPKETEATAETEAPKETEAPAETEAPKETEVPAETEAPKETEATEEEKPEVPFEPEAKKAPEETASVKAKKSADFVDKSFKITNGILTWEAVDGATSYRIVMSSMETYVTTNSIDIYGWIDQLIKERKIFNDDGYDLYIEANDADGSDFARTDYSFNYKSKAVPAGQLPEITNPDISSDGNLTWDQYDNGNDLEGYYIRIIGKETYTAWASMYDLNLDLKSTIASIVAYNGFTECTSYKIQVFARSYSKDAFVAESSVLTYNYKQANTLTVKAKKAAKVSASKAKRKNQTVKISKVLTVKKAIGKVTYAKASGNKKITINKSNGKITVKKKIKRGTYKVQILVKAAGNSTHVMTTKRVTIKIKVK